jgi:hypothetical protein
MPAFSVKLGQLYQLDLAQSRVEKKNWDEQPVKNKLRKFFLTPGWAGSGWEAYIDSVKCSIGGAKGVFFLNLKDRNIQITKDKTLDAALCAAKATNAPQQTLFAESILQDIGQAKIPKSLVIKLNWSAYTALGYDNANANWQALDPKQQDDGLKLLWVLMTKRDPSLSPVAQTRYQQLLTDLFTSKPAYFIIMKGVRIDNKLDFKGRFDPATRSFIVDLKGDMKYSVPFCPFVTKMVDPFNLPNQQATNQAYGLADIGTIERELEDWWAECNKQIGFARKGYPSDVSQLPRFAGQQNQPKWYTENAVGDPAFAKVLQRIFLNKLILSNASLMKKVGRILAVDTLIGNTDRFEGGSNGMNIGNAFFYSKIYSGKTPKAANPIAVIDNDAMLTLLDLVTPEGSLGINPTTMAAFGSKTTATAVNRDNAYGATQEERYCTRYLQYVFEDGLSDLTFGAGGAGIFPYPNLKRLFKNFDLYIAEQLVRTFLPLRRSFINDFYADDGTIAPGAAGVYPRFSESPHNQGVIDPTWAPVVANIKAGFLEGMEAILDLDLEKYRAMYFYLFRLYGVSTHFDFTAFEVRLMYITHGPQWIRDPQTGRITGFQHDDNRHNAVKDKIKTEYLLKRNPSKDKLEKILSDAEKNQQLGKDERRLATQLLRLQFGCP